MPTDSNDGSPSASGNIQHTDMAKPQKRSRKNAFFKISPVFRGTKPAGLRLLNKRELFAGTTLQIICPPGNFERGFRNYPKRPHFHVSRKFGRELYDIEHYSEYWLVSERAHDVLQGICEKDITFAEVNVDVDPGCEPRRLWFADVITILDAVDEIKSRVQVGVSSGGERIHSVMPLNSIFIDQTRVGDRNVFRMRTSFPTVVCNSLFVDAIKDHRLTGLTFKDMLKL